MKGSVAVRGFLHNKDCFDRLSSADRRKTAASSDLIRAIYAIFRIGVLQEGFPVFKQPSRLWARKPDFHLPHWPHSILDCYVLLWTGARANDANLIRKVCPDQYGKSHSSVRIEYRIGYYVNLGGLRAPPLNNKLPVRDGVRKRRRAAVSVARWVSWHRFSLYLIGSNASHLSSWTPQFHRLLCDFIICIVLF